MHWVTPSRARSNHGARRAEGFRTCILLSTEMPLCQSLLRTDTAKQIPLLPWLVQTGGSGNSHRGCPHAPCSIGMFFSDDVASHREKRSHKPCTGVARGFKLELRTQPGHRSLEAGSTLSPGHGVAGSGLVWTSQGQGEEWRQLMCLKSSSSTASSSYALEGGGAGLVILKKKKRFLGAGRVQPAAASPPGQSFLPMGS